MTTDEKETLLHRLKYIFTKPSGYHRIERPQDEVITELIDIIEDLIFAVPVRDGK